MRDSGDGTGTVTHTQRQVAANWNTGVTTGTPEAADINTDGIPDLWEVFTDGTYRTYLISGLSTGNAATVTATRPQPLVQPPWPRRHLSAHWCWSEVGSEERSTTSSSATKCESEPTIL